MNGDLGKARLSLEDLVTGFSAVSVEDVAAGHILAMQKGRSGERYILSGENVKLVDFFEILGKISGKKPPGIKLPRPLAIGMAAMFELAAGITKSEPLATVQAMKSITNRYGFYSCARAGKELSYKPRPLDQTLRSTVEWFEKNPLT
jgi:dihydroflavonol-4-reductase